MKTHSLSRTHKHAQHPTNAYVETTLEAPPSLVPSPCLPHNQKAAALVSRFERSPVSWLDLHGNNPPHSSTTPQARCRCSTARFRSLDSYPADGTGTDHSPCVRCRRRGRWCRRVSHKEGNRPKHNPPVELSSAAQRCRPTGCDSASRYRSRRGPTSISRLECDHWREDRQRFRCWRLEVRT